MGKIQFSDTISIFRYSYITFHKDLQKDPTPSPTSFIVGRPIPSFNIIDKYIKLLFITNTLWSYFPTGTPKSLRNMIQKPLTLEILTQDLINIYNDFRRYKNGYLGKNKWKLPYEIEESFYNFRELRHEYTGRILSVAPKLRLYLLKVIKDRAFATLVIQTAWRQKRDHKLLQQLKIITE